MIFSRSIIKQKQSLLNSLNTQYAQNDSKRLRIEYSSSSSCQSNVRCMKRACFYSEKQSQTAQLSAQTQVHKDKAYNSLITSKIKFLICLLMQLFLLKQTYTQTTFLPTSFVAYSNSAYQVSIFTSITSNIDVGSSIQISLPKQYSIEDLYRNAPYLGYNSSAFDTCNGADCSAVTISYQANRFRLNNIVQATVFGFFFMQYTIFNIPNPAAGTTDDYQVTLLNSSGTSIISETVNGNVFTTPTLTVSGSIDIPQIWSVSPLSLTIQPNANLLHVDTIKLSFPSRWPNENRITSTLVSPVSCISSSHPTLYCIQSNQNIQILNINPASGNISPTSIIVKVNSIFNPSAIIDISSITVQTYDISNTILERAINVQIGGLKNSTLRQTKVQIKAVATKTCTILIQTKLPRFAISGDRITIGFPSELTFISASLSVSVTIGGNIASASPSSNSALRTVTVSPFTSTVNQPLVAITISGITRPRSAIQTSDFTIYTTRTQSNNAFMDQITCCRIKFNPDETLVATVIPDNLQRLTSGVSYVFTMTIQLQILTSDSFIIEFPNQYYPSVNSQAVCTSINSSTGASVTTPQCSFLASTKKLRVFNFITSNTLGSHTFVLTVDNITNPSLPVTPNFNIYTFSAAAIQINSQNSINVTFQSATINTFSVTPLSLIVAQRNTGLVLTVGGLGSLFEGYLIQVTVPQQIKLNINSAVVCTVNSIASRCSTETSSGNNKVLILISSNSLGALSTINIQNVKNPASFQPTGNFGVKVYQQSSSSLVLQQTSASIISKISMTTETSFSSLLVYPEQQFTNLNSNKLTIQIIAPFTFDLLGTTFSLEVQISQTAFVLQALSSCESLYTSFSCGFVTNSSGIFINANNININGGATALNVIQFNITKVIVINAASQWIKSSIKDQNGFKSLLQNYTIGNRSLVSTELDFTITQSTYAMGQSAVISISYSLPTTFVSNASTLQISYIIVVVPDEYSPNSPVNISSITSPLVINLNNPTSTRSGNFRLQAYSSSNHLLAVSSVASQNADSNRFNVKCTVPCRTCSSTNTSRCLSCYSTTISSYQFFDNTTFECLNNCPTYIFTNATTNQKFCLPCDATCRTCASNDKTICTSCQSPNYLFQSSNTCLNICPDQFYESQNNASRICLPCQIQCKRCDNLTHCSSCQVGFLLFSNQCLSACPTRTVNTISGSQAICINCTNNCLKCTISQCLLCQSNFYLHLGQCISGCPFGLYPSYQETCASCLCQSCINFNYKCTSCFSALVKNKIFNNSCLANCPDGYYVDALKVCQPCPSECILCTSINFCTRCQQNYKYSNGNCLSNCPAGTIAILDNSSSISQSSLVVCQNCQFPCTQCIYSRTFCTQCSSSSSPIYILHNNTCVTNCPFPLHAFFPECKRCTHECQQCVSNNPYNCTQCISNYYLLNNTCFSTCPAGYFHQLTSKQCLNCFITCATCSNPNNCTTCISGYYLFNYLCYNLCPQIPIKYFQYKGACTLCQPQCVSCLDSPISCVSCSTVNRYLFNPITRQCSLNCTLPYFSNVDNTQCITCQSPCLTCDHTYYSCSTCNSSLHVLHLGSCMQSCPYSYFKNTTINQCQKCKKPCLQCTQSRCLVCQAYAFMVGTSCALSCPPQLPFQSNGVCTACLSIQFCSICDETKIDSFNCYECAYPYVLFFDQCLNSCPTNYTSIQNNSTNFQASTYMTCVQSDSYKQYLRQLQQFNEPLLPPFIFFAAWIAIGILVGLVSTFVYYKYTYLIGYFIGVLGVIDVCIVCYYLFYITSRYEGQTISLSGGIDLLFGKETVWYIMGIGIGVSFLVNIIFLIVVVFMIYSKDIRYRQWKEENKCALITSVIITLVAGNRGHKLFYSKLIGLDFFSYRILSVSKFYEEDIFTFIYIFIPDMIELFAVIVVAYNVSMSYTVLFLCGIQIVLVKAVLWILLIFDLRKKDIGFFKGDQQWAEEEQQKMRLQEAQQKSNDKFESLIKLIRTKSAAQLHHDKQWQIDPIQFISQYDPNDYEEVIKVPNKKIEKNIYKGKFRKGRRITIQEKLQRFASYYKPLPKPLKKDENDFIWKQIYWKAPKALRIQAKQEQALQQPSQENLLHLLQQKQFQYKDQLDKIQLPQSGKKLKRNIDKDDSLDFNTPHYKPRKNVVNQENSRYRRGNQFNVFDDLDETIPNQTIHDFYPSYQSRNKKDSHDFTLDIDDIMNLNYAKKKHLIKQKRQEQYQPQFGMRVLKHQPRKKRNRVSELERFQKQRERQFLESGNRSKGVSMNSKQKRSGSNQKKQLINKYQMSGTMAGFGNMVIRPFK